MSTTIERGLAEGRSDRFVSQKADAGMAAQSPNMAVSATAIFSDIKELLENSPPPRRPNRNQPVASLEIESRAEIAAWNRMSDELSANCGWE